MDLLGSDQNPRRATLFTGQNTYPGDVVSLPDSIAAGRLLGISALFSPRMTSLCKQQLPSRKATRVHATVYSLHSRQCGIDDRRPQSITRSLTLVGVARMSLEQAMAGDQFNSKLDTGDGGAAGRLHAMMSRQGDLCQE